MTVCALTIAGSDPSGGAGIQADLRVFNALGVAGLSAITALTVQNSNGVLDVQPVPADVLFDQIEAILEDSPVQAVKIGMLGGAEQVRAVAEALRRFRPPNVVLDPVLASTGGVSLLDEAGRRALLEELLPLCDLVTPNLPELAKLTGIETESDESIQRAGISLLATGAGAVLIKGGHREEDVSDVLIDPEDAPGGAVYMGRRIDSRHTHGTGCFLSSAIAARLAQSQPLHVAVQEGKGLVELALASPVIMGSGRGYPNLPTTTLEPSRWGSRGLARRLSLLQGVYVLTDADLRPDRSAADIVAAALDGSARIVQLRDKRTSTPDLVVMAERLKLHAWREDALFIVNDRVDVALASNADGVHLGPDDMPPLYARMALGPEMLIGVSVSTVEEAETVAQYASYLAVGAIFGSSTKSDAGPPVGVERIREIKRAFPNHPIVAIGGINQENIAVVAEAGADAAAVVSAVVCAPDMRAATEELQRRFQEGRKRREVEEK